MSHRGDLDPRLPMPEWLSRERCPHTTNKNTLRGIKYYRHLYKATPKWITDEMLEEIKQIYKEASRRRESGEDIVTDHIVPLVSDLVCGLQVPWNLQYLTDKENSVKSNKWWPDHPFENLELF